MDRRFAAAGCDWFYFHMSRGQLFPALQVELRRGFPCHAIFRRRGNSQSRCALEPACSLARRLLLHTFLSIQMNPFDRVSSTTPPRRAGSAAAFLLWRTSQVAGGGGGGGSQRLKVFAEVKLAKPVLKSLSLCCFSCQQQRRRQQTPVHCAFFNDAPTHLFWASANSNGWTGCGGIVLEFSSFVLLKWLAFELFFCSGWLPKITQAPPHAHLEIIFVAALVWAFFVLQLQKNWILNLRFLILVSELKRV